MDEREVKWFTVAMKRSCEELAQIGNLQADGFNKMIKLASLVKGWNESGGQRLDAIYYWRLIVHELALNRSSKDKRTREAYKMAQNAWKAAKPRKPLKV